MRVERRRVGLSERSFGSPPHAEGLLEVRGRHVVEVGADPGRAVDAAGVDLRRRVGAARATPHPTVALVRARATAS